MPELWRPDTAQDIAYSLARNVFVIALTGFPHEVFPLRHDVRELLTDPGLRQAANATAFIMENCQHHLDFASWLVCLQLPAAVARDEFVELCNFFCILQGQLLFVLCQLLWKHVTRWRERFFSLFSLNSAIIYFITEPTTSTQEQPTWFSRMGVGTLNQSTRRDGSIIIVVIVIIILHIPY